ncbi:MAG: sodium:solute symporter family protein, partial [Candidatus Marinimicrobia bacterium]|nr:sodium:solute symporter family protein [Candidatus Neomarinimicrobiota bacterium]MBT7115220.1 sodium:solute symporter family protein [Candidatus Neomarinimicrobiota bacterium]
MFGFHVADFIVLILYFIGITGIGIWSAKKVKTVGDYFMPRSFGKSALIMHAFGTGTHSDQAVGVASKTFSSGLSGIWYQWLWLFVTPFYWLIAPVLRRFRAITMADVFVARYDNSVGMLYAVVGMFQLMVNIGLMLKGSSVIISATFGDAISPTTVITIMTALFLVYGIAGGLSAAIVTDFIQGILTVIFSFLLLPFVMNAVGGMKGLHETITNPDMFSLIAPAEIGIFYIVIIAINGLIGIVTQPHTMGNCAAGRTEMDGRVGFTIGNFIKRICTIAWSLTGLAAVAYLIGNDVEPDKVYGVMARDFLPQIMPGLLGIFLASLLASVMSSCDSFMVASSALFTENIYRPLMNKKSSNHYLMVGRITSLFIVAGGVAFAFWLPGVVKGLEIFWKISPMMGIVFWLGLFWRRMTVTAAWAATFSAFFMWWITTQAGFITFVAGLPMAESMRFIFEKSGSMEIYLPWQMVFYLTTGIFVGVVVSLFTKPVDEGQLESFYALSRTPVTKGE